MRVLHITESMAAGVLSVIEILAEKQSALGASVGVVFMSRPDTPSDAELRLRFPAGVVLQRLDSVATKAMQYFELARIVRSAAVSGSWDAIHLHSSIAGAVGRIAILGTRRSAAVFYSPHGFAFLREDLGPFKQRLATSLETHLARRGDGLILVSQSEQRVAVETLGAVNAYVLRNGVNLDGIPRFAGSGTGQLVVAMVGRVTYQKAPWRFAAVARALNGNACFRWLGGGEDEAVDTWLADSPVEVSGWLSRGELMVELAKVDIVVFPTLWEGMPLSLMEVQAMGIPAVASAVGGNVDVVVDGHTGFLVSTDEQLISRTAALLDDHMERRRMSTNARNHAKANLSDAHLGTESLAIYASGHSRSKLQAAVL